jgi:hypothetical protein
LFDSAVLALLCEDPYWFDPVAVTDRRESGTGVDYLAPFPSVSSGRVLGTTTLVNPGDVVAWPRWIVTGPASLITFTHDDTGQQFALNPAAVGGTLGEGEQVMITTDPPRVRYEETANWAGALDWPNAQLWGLEPGRNNVTFQLDGSGPSSSVRVEYHPRYETA